MSLNAITWVNQYKPDTEHPGRNTVISKALCSSIVKQLICLGFSNYNKIRNL